MPRCCHRERDGDATNAIDWNNDPQYGFDLSGNCYDAPGHGDCVSVTAPGPLLGAYDDMTLSVSQVNSQGPAVPLAGSSTYVEQYLLSPGSSPDYGRSRSVPTARGAPIRPSCRPM